MSRNESLWRPPIPVLAILGAMVLLCVILILQEYVSYSYGRQEYPFNWRFVSIANASSYLLWAAFSPLIYRLSRAFGQGKKVSIGKVSTHILGSIGIAFLHRILSSLTLFSIFWIIDGKWFGGFDNHTYSSIMVNVFSSFLIYWVFVGLFVAVDYYRSLREKQLELVRMENDLNNAQLSALKMQLHPHFLFNTLHAIASMMDENVERAQKMVAQLGSLLRNILDHEQTQKVRLKEEIKFIRNYLDIEQTRFQDRLKVEYNLSANTLSANIPNLILQPLVENAIKHGFSKRTDSGTIKVSSRRKNGDLEIVIEDDGKGVRDTAKLFENDGIGLKNVQKRLNQMYKENYTFELDSPNKRGFVAKIRLPFEELN